MREINLEDLRSVAHADAVPGPYSPGLEAHQNQIQVHELPLRRRRHLLSRRCNERATEPFDNYMDRSNKIGRQNYTYMLFTLFASPVESSAWMMCVRMCVCLVRVFGVRVMFELANTPTTADTRERPSG